MYSPIDRASKNINKDNVKYIGFLLDINNIKNIEPMKYINPSYKENTWLFIVVFFSINIDDKIKQIEPIK